MAAISQMRIDKQKLETRLSECAAREQRQQSELIQFELKRSTLDAQISYVLSPSLVLCPFPVVGVGTLQTSRF